MRTREIWDVHITTMCALLPCDIEHHHKIYRVNLKREEQELGWNRTNERFFEMRHMQINSCVKMICLHKMNKWDMALIKCESECMFTFKLRHVFVNRSQRAAVSAFLLHDQLLQHGSLLITYRYEICSATFYCCCCCLTYIELSRDFNGLWATAKQS